MVFYIAPTLILIAGLVDDLRSQKVHNWLVGVACVFALTVTWYLAGWPGVQSGLLAAGTAILIILPLVLLGALGAGDMKLMVAFGLATQPGSVFEVVVFSLFWGLLLGIIHALLNKEGLSLIKNMGRIMTTKKAEHQKVQLHKIPYTVALLFGWLTHISLATRGGGLL